MALGVQKNTQADEDMVKCEWDFDLPEKIGKLGQVKIQVLGTDAGI